jgi:uncharacterized protein (DUF433 family)
MNPYVELRPDRAGRQKAYLVGTRIGVADIYVRHELQGQTPDQIVAALPHLSLAQVHGALAYFYDHAAEIRAHVQEDETFVANLQVSSGPGPLKQKLQEAASRAAVSPG